MWNRQQRRRFFFLTEFDFAEEISENTAMTRIGGTKNKLNMLGFCALVISYFIGINATEQCDTTSQGNAPKNEFIKGSLCRVASLHRL